MTPAADPRQAASAPAALGARARISPHDPWLFYRDGWDWRWRSWSRVADQVARGAEVLRREIPTPGARIAFVAAQDPDAVSAGLAIRAAGAVAIPVGGTIEDAARHGCAALARVGGASDAAEPIPCIELPAALSPLETTPRRALEDADSAPGGLGFAAGDPPRVLPPEALLSAARRLDALLPHRSKRPIACAAPGLDVRAERLVEAWTLVRGAAWVLEPLADAFVATVLWARPTLVFGHGADLEPLAEPLKARKHRRHRRLEAVVVAGSGAVAPAPWDDLGIGIVALQEERTEDREASG